MGTADAPKDEGSSMNVAISSYVVRELAAPAPFEADISGISEAASRTARRRGRRRAEVAELSTTSESDAEPLDSDDELTAQFADAAAVAPSQPKGLEDDASLRYQLDLDAVEADLESVAAATLSTALDSGSAAASPSSAGKRVREVLRRLEVDLEKMAQGAKHTWRAQAAEHLRLTGGASGGSQESELAAYMQGFFTATREHVTLAQKHVASAAKQQSAAMNQQMALCKEGLLAVARDHVRAAVAEQTGEARAVIQWQRRERQEQLEESRQASSIAIQEAMEVTRQQAANKQAAIIETHEAERTAAVAQMERRMNEDRLKAVALKDVVLQESNAQIEELADENEELKSRVSAQTDETLVMKEHIHRTEAQLQAVSVANKRLHAKLKDSEAESNDEQKKRAECEQALANEERKTRDLAMKLQKQAADFEEKIATYQAELEHAQEELSEMQGRVAETCVGGVSSNDQDQPGPVGWICAGSDIVQRISQDAAGARVPSQIVNGEEARLAAAVIRESKVGRVVHLLSTSGKKVDRDHKSPANLAKKLRQRTKQGVGSKTAADAAHGASSDNQDSTSTKRSGSLHRTLNLRETLAVTHELSEHASRSLRLGAADDASPRKRHARLQLNAKTSLPTDLVSAMHRAGSAFHQHGAHGPEQGNLQGNSGSTSGSHQAINAGLDSLRSDGVGTTSPPTSLLHDAYEYFLATTGHARLALTHMSNLHKGLAKHRAKHPRLEVWSRFLGIATPSSERYPTVLFHAYLNVLNHVQALHRDHIQIEADGTLWVPHRAAVRAAERGFACWLKSEELEKLLQESAQLVVMSISMQQKALPFDAFIAPLLSAALTGMIRAAQTLKVLFWAADVRADGQLSLKECKQMIIKVLELMRDGGSLDETAPSHALSGDGSGTRLLSLYRRLSLGSNEHGSISEETWVRTAFDAGLIPTHDAGGRPFLRSANVCWSAPQGALERVQAILQRLDRQQSELLRRDGDSDEVNTDIKDEDAISRIDHSIKDWSKRRDRVETILRKKLPPHGGRQSGVNAVHAVRALALRINEAEGLSLSPEEAAVVQADESEQDAETPVSEHGIVTHPSQTAIPAVEWGSEAARECYQELQLEKEHLQTQLKSLQLESEGLVRKQLEFKTERDKLKAEIKSLKSMLLKHTMTDIEEEMEEKDAKITALSASLLEAQTQLDEMMKIGEAATDKDRSGVPRKKKFIRSVSKTRILLERTRATTEGKDTNAVKSVAAAESVPLTVDRSETPTLSTLENDGITAAEQSSSLGEQPMTRGSMENELLQLCAQLATIIRQGTDSVSMANEDTESAQIVAVRQVVAALKAVGQVTGLNDAVRRMPGFTEGLTVVSSRPNDSSAVGNTTHANPDAGHGRHEKSSVDALDLSLRGRPASASTSGIRQRQRNRPQRQTSVQSAKHGEHAREPVSTSTSVSSVMRTDASSTANDSGKRKQWVASKSNVDARAATASASTAPYAQISTSSVDLSSVQGDATSALGLSTSGLSAESSGLVSAKRSLVTIGPRRQGRWRPASASNTRRGAARSAINDEADNLMTQHRRPGSARVVRPKIVPEMELVWAGRDSK